MFDETDPGIVQLMTFNIRYGSAGDGPNRWDLRKDLIFDTIADHEADIIGLQEVLDFQMEQLRRALPQYASIFVGRDDGQLAGEGVPILYRRDRFTAADSGTFWFSNSPWKPGSKHWGNQIPRICTWLRLTEITSGKSVYVYNVHLDHQSQDSRLYSVNLLVKEIAGREHRDPVVVLGDFNMDMDNEAMHAFGRIKRDVAFEPMFDVWGKLNPDQPSETTFHGFGEQPDGPCLDHILIDDNWEIFETAIDARAYGGRYPSDHFPVIATLNLKD